MIKRDKVFDPLALGLEIAGKSGDELIVFCPYHNDTKPSAEYNVQKGLFHCFGCHTNKNARQIATDLGGYLVMVSAESTFGFGEFDEEVEEREWVKLLSNPIATGNEYLEQRLVEDWQIELHKIRANSKQIIFPMIDQLGVIQGIQVRNLTTERRKYMFYGDKTPLWPMKDIQKKKFLVVVEGVFGVLRAEKYEINAVATLGSSNVLTVSKVLKGMRNTMPVIFMDHDFAGFLAAGKYALLGFHVIINGKGIDPDDMNKAEWETLLEEMELTKDVNRIIDLSPDPKRLMGKLESFWSKL